MSIMEDTAEEITEFIMEWHRKGQRKYQWEEIDRDGLSISLDIRFRQSLPDHKPLTYLFLKVFALENL